MANEIPAGRPERQPTHPGKLLHDVVVPALRENGISVVAFAEHLGVTRQTVYAILRCERPITPDIAGRLERALGSSSAMWLGMQAAHDAWEASRKPELKSIKRLSLSAPGF
jgi:addiction module HigA family antidote